jgi:hypothetical protein
MPKLWAETIDGSALRQAQASIDDARRGAVRDARRRNPNALDPPVKVRVEGAPRVIDGPQPTPGWYEPKPLASPPGQEAIERLVQDALPHGPGSKAK